MAFSELTNCTVSSNQEAASAIPGNIGIARARVLIWDHDPMLARPTQTMTFPFSRHAAEQFREQVTTAFWELNSVMLKPRFDLQDMWMYSINSNAVTVISPLTNQPITVQRRFLDPVPCPEAEAEGRLPGTEDPQSLYQLDGRPHPETGKADKTTGKSMFPHQTWIHIGSLFRQGVIIHPSEYDRDLCDLAVEKGVLNNITPSDRCSGKVSFADLEASAKWDCVAITDSTTGRRSYSPLMISKQVPDTTNPVHWSIEKLTPVWQGQDFFVTISKDSKKTDDSIDPGETFDPACTTWEQYKYLLYDIAEGSKPTSTVGQDAIAWVDGISNEAFYIPPNRSGQASQTPPGSPNDPRETAQKSAREEYWWKFKSYILVEVGAGHPEHNYFIELVKGRKPRFLHLGEEWDNVKRLQEQADVTADDFKKIRKCRVLSEYENLSCDELFKKEEFRFSVRNHLNRLVVTFEGFEGEPWVITRLDNDDTRFDYSKIIRPCIVPAGKIRIHGGNISCAVNYSPTRYVQSTVIPFRDRQADSFDAEDEDLYMTFAQFGASEKHRNDSVRERYFDDRRFEERKIGYDLDAAITSEYLKNRVTELNIYQLFSKQYKAYGKGWVLNRPNQTPNAVGLLPDPEVVLGFERGNEHKAKIVNSRSLDKKFEFGLNEEADASYPYKEYVSRWDVGIKLEAGTVTLPPVDGELDPTNGEAEDKDFENYITPIVNNWSLWFLGGSKPFGDSIDPIDVSDLCESINDSWSAEAFTTINHEMKLRFYIPDSFLPVSDQPGEGQINPNLHALGQTLLKLHNKTFYVTVSYWWDNGIGERDAPGNRRRRIGPPDNNDLLIQMTGLAYGGTLEKSVNKLYMDCTVKDYSSILENQFIFNSPFFDGNSDSLAIYELARLAGFDDDKERQRGIDRRPLGYLQRVLNDPRIIECESFVYNGEASRNNPFDLPGSYADVANPSVRFQNGESYWSAMKKIASLATKVLYFDRWGVLRYENIPAIEAAFQSGERIKFKPIFEFTTSPFPVSSSGDGGGLSTTERFNFNPRQHASHLVYEVVRYSRSVEDCVNQIILFTASNDILLNDGTTTGGFIIEGYTFFEQMFDPNAEGFLGYRKPFYQSNGVFGGIEGVRRGIQHYAKMKYPPVQISFQTYGVPGLKALDIITLDDNLFYITEISHEINPEENKWWMNITAEWLKPFLGDLGFLEETGENDSGTGGGGAGGQGGGGP